MSKKKKKKPKTFEGMLAKKTDELTFDEKYSRRTLFIEDEVHNALNKLAAVSEVKGFKTKIVNHAIKKVLRKEYGWNPDKDKDEQEDE